MTLRAGPSEKLGIRRVHVGCGPHNLLPDWWNVDLREFPGVDQVMDVTRPWKWSNLDYVYGEHFLEHLPIEAAFKFVQYAGNALHRGGILRLSTPNLEWVMLTHFSREAASSEKRIADTLVTNRAFHGWGHQFLYTKEMLEYLLQEMGFSSVRFFPYGESDTPGLQGLERHGDLDICEGRPSVIVAEAEKGMTPIAPSAALTRLFEETYLSHVRSGH